MEELADLLAGGAGDVVGLVEGLTGGLGQPTLGLLDHRVELALELDESLVELLHAGLERLDEILELGLAGTDPLVEELHQFAPADLGLLEGEHAHAHSDVDRVLGELDELVDVEGRKIDGSIRALSHAFRIQQCAN